MKQIFKKFIIAVLAYEARILLNRTKPFIITVTGSVGKTSTKDAIFSVLKTHCHVRKSEKSFNSEIGVPLSILGLPNAWDNPISWLKNLIDGAIIAFFSKKYPEVLVLETGVDRPGDMANLASWLRPNIVVMTRLPDVPVHVEYFSSPEAVVAEKLELLNALKPDGVFIYNHDDEKLQSATNGVRQVCIGYSRYTPTQFKASADTVLYRDDVAIGSTFTLTHLDEHVQIKIMGSVGVQNTYTYGAAAAVASQFDISLSEVATTLQNHQVPPGRMSLLSGLKNTLIIDDTYNSSPTAAESALLSLKELKGAKRKIAILGDMLELGRFSSREHEKIGELVPQCADVLITLGVRSRKTAQTALEHGMSEKVIFQYDDVARAGRELQSYLSPGDVVLVKASQSIRAERIVEEIMSEPERAKELLVRQDVSWKKR
ncbi:hypothetical protein COY24_04140 [Candidatus Uhrbacteria bacterium CG_4_10_14_0_2_um_filter_41_21]|nr:MAG: hypothetical protein COY24_04140 [Candidatus Uhrbacteria bacterium CG_4_10_14_0_2_um_filter_41_21]